ncbi:MAG: hypothetical protein PARBA_03150 [Parabacteroides sp.]
MWQDIAIIIIGIFIVVNIGFKIYKFLTRPATKNNPCCGCQGCNLKKEIIANKSAKNKNLTKSPTSSSKDRPSCK